MSTHNTRDSQGGAATDHLLSPSQQAGQVYSRKIDDNPFSKVNWNKQTSKIISLLDKLSKFIIGSLLTIGISCAACAAIGILGIFDSFLLLLLCSVLNCFGAALGAYGIYKFGTVHTQIDIMAKENQLYDEQTLKLCSMRETTKYEVRKLQISTNVLKKDCNLLQKQMDAFEDLKKHLEDICEDNESLLHMLDELNDCYSEMSLVILENERAALFKIYYEMEFMDSSNGLSLEEYEMFQCQLSIKQRERFDRIGSFGVLAGDDKIIDLEEFQQIIDQMMVDMEHELVVEAVSTGKQSLH